jgi:hypothetical protein
VNRTTAGGPALAASRARLLLAVLAIVAVLAPLTLSACGAGADPFAGTYWEPSTGRRIEIKHTADGYELFYGRDLRPFPAARAGDQLTITDAMGGKTVVRPGTTEGTLQLVTGGKTTVLKPLPQHQ